MAHSGPNVPHRTPRKRALEIGTDSKGFVDGVDMEGDAARAGHPSLPGMTVGGYEEMGPHVDGATPASPHATPFKLGGK